MSIERRIPYTEKRVLMPELPDVVAYLDHLKAEGFEDEVIYMNDHLTCLGAQTVLWLNPEFEEGQVSYSWSSAAFAIDGDDMGARVDSGLGVGNALESLCYINPHPTTDQARDFITEWIENNHTDDEYGEEFQPLATSAAPSSN